MITDDQQSRHPAPGLGAEPLTPGIRTSGKAGSDWPVLVSAVLVAGINVVVITGFHAPFLRPAIGFWFLVVAPVYILCTTSVWGTSSVAERVGYSTAGVLFLSEDDGKHWKPIQPQWTGRAVLVRARPVGTQAAALSAPQTMRFELVNDKLQTWISYDGKTWTQQPIPLQ